MRGILSIALIAVVAGPAVAAGADDSDKKKSDMDRIVCEREEQIGSRLGGAKVCKTVRAWQEQRRDQREHIERIQQQSSGKGAGG